MGRKLLGFLLLAILSLPSPARAGSASLTTGTAAHGVRLTLTVPQQVYPKNSLIQVTLQLQNVSGRAIHLGVGNDSWCGDRAPWAQVVKSNGSAVYPLAMPDAAGPSCAGMYSSRQIPGPSLAPGHRIIRRFLVILRTDRIREIVELFTSKGLLPVRTPSIRLRLVAGLSPRMAWTRSPAMWVDIRPGGSNWEGPLRYVFAWSCGSSRTGFLQEGLDIWTVAHGSRFRPGCALPQQWDLVAGWLNHPVATIDYIRPSRQAISVRLRT